MAQGNFGSLGRIEDLSDVKKIQAYLYKLTEQLTYMFNNLDPEDNFSNELAAQYKTIAEQVSDQDVRISNLEAKVNNLDKRLKQLGG